MKNFLKIFIFLSLSANTIIGEANASGQIKVTATVNKYCNAKASAITFGNYGANDLKARSTIQIICTAGTVFYIGVSNNSHTMTSNTNGILKYYVFQDSHYSNILGGGIVNNTISGIGTGKTETIVVYAIIKSGQSAPAGFYSDTLNITLSF